MALGIGVKIGADTCVATVASDAAWEATIMRDTARLVGRDDFLDRVGDPVALVDADGAPIAAADLFADAVEALVQAVVDEIGDVSSARLGIAHPDGWTAEALDAARRTVADRAGLAGLDAVWQPTAVAAVAAAEHAHGSFADDSLVVCHDLGAFAVTVSVVRVGDEPELVGRSLTSSAVSGREFDRLLLADVLDVTGAGAALGTAAESTLAAPSVLDDLDRLRADCRAAKEALSVDTDTVVDVAVGSVRTEARLVREDVENLLRAPILESAALIREALIAADVESPEVTAIVATGGGAAIPLVAELLSTGVRVPVVVDPDPVSAPAAGAALLLSRGSAAATAVLPAAAATPTAVQPAEPPLRGIIPAPALPVGEPEPRLSRRRRGTLVAVGTAALAVITATGLSVGTGLVGNSDPATPAPAGAAVSEAPSSRTSSGTGTNTTPQPRVEQLESRSGVAGATTTAPGTTAAEQTGTPPAPRTQAPGTQAPGSQAPGTQAPGTPAPGSQNPGTPPPGTSSPGTTQNPDPNPPATTPPAEFPDDSGTGGGGSGGGGLTRLPGEIVGGAGDTVCGVTDLVCLGG